MRTRWPHKFDPTARMAEQLERNEWALTEKTKTTLVAVIMATLEEVAEEHSLDREGASPRRVVPLPRSS